MKNMVRQLAIGLLLFNGITSVFGGFMLIIKPDGSGLGMSPDILQFSPFTNFLIPGIILLTANGVLSLVVVFFTFRQLSAYGRLIILQGCILLGWITVQMVMLQTVNSLHIIYGLAGMLLVASGVKLSQKNVLT
jgi:hypothetical protein